MNAAPRSNRRWLLAVLVSSHLAAVSAQEKQEKQDSFTFGESAAEPEPEAEAGADGNPAAEGWRFRVDRAVVEQGVLTEGDHPVDGITHAEAEISLARRFGWQWEIQLGAHLEGQRQDGGTRPEASRTDADYAESWLRYRADDWQFTVGTQEVVWGRVDERPPTDGLSTRDFTRFALDELAHRRRASPALRFEAFPGPWKLDAVYLPVFREAELPDRDSIWHPVDRTAGRFLGRPATRGVSELIRSARFTEDDSGAGGGGLRISRSGGDVDFALTAQRARRSAPYYRLDDASRADILAGREPRQQPEFIAEHPYTWLLGGDFAFAAGGWTWRGEAAWRSDVPVTRSADFALDTVDGVSWALGMEGFPGGGDFRTTLQLSGDHLIDAGRVQDLENVYRLGGELERPFLDHRLRASVRFVTGLDRHDVFVNPELAWTAWEPHELYIGFHYIDGSERTPGGFFADRDVLMVGWRGEF